ncbi:MAG: hypothetical protein MUC68_04255 [Burkholderiaceae bacterium]|jgi:hypothetical protein|nr:hypothetical protein [Burkholderiaceae bacterium]
MTTFFHVTRAERLPSILRHGLQPAVGRRSRAADDRRPAVYVFPSAQAASDALATWLGDEYEHDAALVMLEVDVSCLQLHWPKGPDEAVCFDAVPPHCITGHRPVAPRQPLPEVAAREAGHSQVSPT